MSEIGDFVLLGREDAGVIGETRSTTS